MVATTLPDHDHVLRTEDARCFPDRFDVGPVIGRGGMGEVRLAHDLRVNRDVAIKLLRGTPRPESVARFLREARVQARLDHPAVVPVYDVGVDDNGVPYFAMKRLTGVTLERVLEAHVTGDDDIIKRWPRRQLIARLVDVCLAIELAHTRGVIHRDLKPSNIMLGDFGEVYVLDWGVASIADAPDDYVSGESEPTTETATGMMLGTPGYMAPEQIEGNAQRRSDVFALGLVLFEILAGQSALPRGGDAYEPTLGTPCHRPSRITEVPPELDAVCARATANQAADRYPTARAMAAAITAYLDGDRDLVRRRELVDAHTRAAGDALARGAHATAMREVGCAVALDPSDRHAHEMLKQILLKPPPSEPAAVRAEREVGRWRDARMQLGFSQKVYACFLALVPFTLVHRSRASISAAIIAATLCFLIAGAGYVKRHPRLLDRWLHVQLFANGLMFTLMGTIVGPFQIVPILGVVSLALFINHPGVRRFGFVIIVHMIIVVIPIVLELAGLTPPTFSFDADGSMTVTLLALDLSPVEIVGAIVLVVWFLQLVISWLLIRQRRAQERARDRLQLYTWRLEQLLPRDAEPRCAMRTKEP